MIPDIDIWRSANVMITGYGETGALEASMRAGDLKESGDKEGAKVWMRIGSSRPSRNWPARIRKRARGCIER